MLPLSLFWSYHAILWVCDPKNRTRLLIGIGTPKPLYCHAQRFGGGSNAVAVVEHDGSLLLDMNNNFDFSETHLVAMFLSRPLSLM